MSTVPAARLSRLFEFARFVGTGALAAVVNLAARYLLDFVMIFEAAVAIAYLMGMVVAFVLFQKLIFGDPGTPLRRRVFRFTVVNLSGGVLALAISSLMARVLLPQLGWTWHAAELAHFVGISAPAFSSYLLHKHYTFR